MHLIHGGLNRLKSFQFTYVLNVDIIGVAVFNGINSTRYGFKCHMVDWV